MSHQHRKLDSFYSYIIKALVMLLLLKAVVNYTMYWERMALTEQENANKWHDKYVDSEKRLQAKARELYDEQNAQANLK